MSKTTDKPTASKAPVRPAPAPARRPARINRLHQRLAAPPPTPQQLQRHGQLFQALIEHSADAICLVDAQARILYTSPASLRTLGYAVEELVGHDAFERMHADDRTALRLSLAELLENPGESLTAECRYQHRDGSWLWLDGTATNLLDDPHVGAIVLNYRDITTRKRTERALQESEERYRALTEAIPQPVWRCDHRGERLDCNRRWYEYTGQTPESAAGFGWMSAVHPDDLARTADRIREVTRTGSLYETEYRLRRAADGSYRWHLARALPMRDRDGRVVYWFGSAVDIDDQKRAEATLRQAHDELETRVQARTAELREAVVALRESEGRFRQVAESIREALWMTNPEKTVMIYISPGYEQIWGRSCQSLYANPRSWIDAVHEEDRARILRAALTQQQQGDYTEEYRIVRPDGTVRWIRDCAFPIRNEAGAVYRIVGVAEDITERKELAREILEVSNREQRRIGQDLHDSICQQLAGVAMMCKGLEQDLAAQSPAAASEAGEIGGLIGKALNEARNLARGLCPLELQGNDLTGALRDLAVSVEGLFGVECLVNCRKPLFLSDRSLATHLYRIAQEAVSNAIRHGQARRVAIGLARHGSEWVLTISDDGQGFPEKPDPGPGLGLRIMNYRARMIGATLEVRRTGPAGGTSLRCAFHAETAPANQIGHGA